MEPTVILTDDPKYITMREEIFGPVITIYLFDDDKFEEALSLVDRTSEYALTGAILAKDRNVIERATKILKHSAGNFYVNDKPTGAVVGRQPFGGARAEFLGNDVPCKFCGFSVLELPKDHPEDGTPQSFLKKHILESFQKKSHQL